MWLCLYVHVQSVSVPMGEEDDTVAYITTGCG